MSDATYLVIHLLPDHSEKLIGEVLIDSNGQLELVSARAEHQDFLVGWVDGLNARKDFVIKEPPPADAPMFTTYGRIFTREQPGFIRDLKAYVKQLYGIKLLTEAERAQELDELGADGL